MAAVDAAPRRPRRVGAGGERPAQRGGAVTGGPPARPPAIRREPAACPRAGPHAAAGPRLPPSMPGTLAWGAAALVLLAAAALKAADRTGTSVAISGYGVPGAADRAGRAAVVAAEAALAAALAAGLAWRPPRRPRCSPSSPSARPPPSCAAAPAHRAGALGGRGRLSPGSLGRTALLAGACALLPVLGDGRDLSARSAPPRPSAWSCWRSAARPAAPDGALEIEGEVRRSARRAPSRCPARRFRLALFVAPGCRLCRRVDRHADRLAAHGVPSGAWTSTPTPWRGRPRRAGRALRRGARARRHGDGQGDRQRRRAAGVRARRRRAGPP